LPFAASAIVAFVVGAIVRRAAIDRGAVVLPRPDRWHRNPTPTFGGIAIFFGLVAGLLLRIPDLYALAPLAVAGAGFALFVVGWYDDLRPMSALSKMVSSLAVAGFFVFSVFYHATPVSAVLSLLAIVWFGGLVNAVNLLDNMDGLAGGVSAIAAGGLALTFRHELGPGLVVVLVALSGGLVGFLGWNRPPARLFMGNCGSLAIGGVLAGASTVAVARAGTATAVVAAVLILAVPLFDTTFVILLRRLAGRSTTRGNIDHTSHRLVSAGFSDRYAVLLLCALGAGGSATGFLIHTQATATWPVATTFGVGVLILGLYLARVPAYGGEEFAALKENSFAPLLTDLTFRWHAGEVLLDLVLITTCYYTAYRLRFGGDADLPVFLGTFAMSLPIVVGCKLAALYASGLYSRMWSTFGFHDLSTVLRGVGAGSMLSVLAAAWLYKFEGFSRSVFIIDAVLLTAAIIGTRLSFRWIARIAARGNSRRRRVLIYGAGARGQLLVREMLANPAWQLHPVAFIDDDAMKRSQRILGVPVRGCVNEVVDLLNKLSIEEVLLSSPSINGSNEASLREACSKRDVPVRRLYLEIR
jgi:UDP-GlcNAc:undecaprenyl-phosphate GlcNAc-1-phosphate transferase